MKHIILMAAAAGLASGVACGADAPFTRAVPATGVPEVPGPAVNPPGNGLVNTPENTPPARAKPAFSLLGKPEGLSPEQLALGQEVLVLLKVGNQSGGEGRLRAYVDAHPEDQKGLLLQGAVIRSRLEGGDATEIFKRVAAIDGTTAEGKAAKAMLEDGDGRDAEKALAAYQALTKVYAGSNESQTIDWLRLMTADESGQVDSGNDGTEFESRMFDSFDQPLMARREMAELMVKTDNVELGESDWGEIVQIVRAGWGFRGLALAQADCHHSADAETSAKRATDLEPKNVDGWLAWAEVLAEEGKTAEAAEKLRHAGELEPRNAAVEAQWGETLLNADDLEGAEDHARRAIRLVPHDRGVHTLLGRVLDKEGKTEAARAQFEIAVQPAEKIWEAAPALPELLPEARVAALHPADACGAVMDYLAAGEQKEARALLDDLVKAHPKDQDVCFLNGVWLFPSIITNDEGKTFLAQAVRGDPDSEKGKFAALMLKVFADPADQKSFDAMCGMVEAHDHEALYLWAGGIASVNETNELRCLEFFGKLSDYFVPGPEIFQYEYARTLAAVVDYREALPHMEMSVRIDPGGWNYVELGWVLGRLRQFRDADAAFAKGLPYAEQFAYRWYDWGRILQRWGHQEDAIGKYERAIGLVPKDDLYFQRLRESLRALGKTEQAGTEWQKAIALYQSKGEAAYAKELEAEAPKGK